MVNPQGMDLLFWADTISVDFPNDNIPVLTDEKAWMEWASTLVAATSFAIENAPPPFSYKEWFPWAQDVYYTMANN